MRAWCSESDSEHVPTGNYWEAHVTHVDAIDLHVDDAFMDALALKVMATYESENDDDETLFLPGGIVVAPDRNKEFYAPLFNADGSYKDEFLTEASETLGMWVEQTFGETVFVKRGGPFNNDFGFDVLSVVSPDDHLRIVQVKATKENLYGNCRVAAAKLGELHRGKYASVLKAKLEAIRRDVRTPDDVDLNEIFLHRRYRVIAVHEEDRAGVTLMTNFADEIPGDAAMRSLRLVRVVWKDFWETLARRIYEQLD
jgi:hypothetical protein